MTELSQALSEINAIRAQVARGTQFRGYGPGSTAATGLLALAVAALQSIGIKVGGASPLPFLALWVGTAAVAVAMTAAETLARARRVHFGFANEMVQAAVEQFLPATMAGAALTGTFLAVAPADLWMLPGLWQLIFSLGVFASCRFLPRPMFGVGLWYLGCGLACLLIASRTRTLLPWGMGIPFGVGQLLVAAVLRYGFEEAIEDQ